MKALYDYIERVGIEYDTAVNVLFGGQLGQTVSMRCALAWKAGKRWGCWACAFLNFVVQRDHCADQFDPNAPTTAATFIRAGIAFGVGTGIVYLAIHRLLEAI